MATKKTIFEEAVLSVKTIQEALNANTKEILRSVAREEIDGLVKESLMEDDYEEETIGDDADDAGLPMGDTTDDTEMDVQSSDEVGPDAGQDMGMDIDTDVTDDVTDVDMLGGDDLDMTGESDDDVLAIYKKLSGEDEIEIVGDEIHLTVSEPGEYIVKAGAEGPAGIEDEPMADVPVDTELGGEGDDEEEMSYEISMDDDDEAGEEEAPEELGGEETPEETPEEEPEEESGEEEEEEELDENKDIPANPEKPEDQPGYIHEDDEDVVEESIPVGTAQAHRLPGKANIGQPKGAGADNLKESAKPSKKVITEAEVKKYKSLLTEATKLKAENEQFRQALKTFKNMLVETVVFNTNLSYVTKLFMEHSTTKDEKASIIKRFDNVSNIKESKKLYKTIVAELGSKKPMTESVESKIIKEVTTGSSKQLNEATVYVDKSTQRIKDLINRVENR